MADMKKKYNEEVVPALMKKMGYKNVMQVPKLKKIVLSMGIGTKMEKDAFTEGKTKARTFSPPFRVSFRSLPRRKRTLRTSNCASDSPSV